MQVNRQTNQNQRKKNRNRILSNNLAEVII